MDVPFTAVIVNSATKNNVTYYLLKIQQDDYEDMNYAVDRRFTDFVELDEKLRLIYGAYIMDQLPQIPKKTLMRQSSDAFVKKRHYYLQQYINGIHEIPYLVHSKTYRKFLKMDSFFPSTIPIRPFLKFVQNKSQHGIRLSNFNMIMLSHNVFISISGCHPEIAFCSPDRIQAIQQRLNSHHSSYKHSTNKSNKTNRVNRPSANKYLTTSEEPQYTQSSSASSLRSPPMHSPTSPLLGRIGNDLTNTPSSSMLPSPNEWGGCIQIWYYDATAMNASSDNFTWWLEERSDNKNFYGWNQSKDKSNASNTHIKHADEHNNMDQYSYYGGADDLPIAQHEIQQNNIETHMKKGIKRKRMKEVHRELDCIYLNEVPSSLHYDREHQQLFVGTLMGNIHRFKIIHNAKIEATGILPNPNIYNNVSNIHSYCHSSVYTYIHHEAFAKDQDGKHVHIPNQQRIHQRLYEQRELLKLKDRQNHHKKAKRKMALIPDNDAVYNKAILNMVSYAGVLYVSDACSNIHAFDIHEFKHLHYLSLDHYFVNILQTEYKVHVDEYYTRRLNQYKAQHEKMMFKSNQPKDIHSDPIIPSFYDEEPEQDSGRLFSARFLKNRSKKTKHDIDDEIRYQNALDVPMRIGGIEASSAYAMYFDELVFSTTITKQKEKILNVTNKLNQDIVVTDLFQFENYLFIPTNLPYLTLDALRYPSEFNMISPEISKTAVLEAKMQGNNGIIMQENENKNGNKHVHVHDSDDMCYSNPYKGRKKKDEWTVIPNKQDKEGIGCDNIFGTVSNFDCNNNVIYSIPTIHTIHKDFLIYDDERIRASAHRTDNTNDMAIYNQCSIFVWGFTNHISVDSTTIDDTEEDMEMESQLTEFTEYDPWYNEKQKPKKTIKKKLGKKKKSGIKERTWYLKCKWFDKTVDYMCKELSALTYCPSVRTLAVSGITGYIALFDANGICFNIFFAHTDTITKMIWIDDSKQLVSTALDGTIKIWDLYHAQWIKNIKGKILSDGDEHCILQNEEDIVENTPPPSQYLNKHILQSPDDISPYKDIVSFDHKETEDVDYNDIADLNIDDDQDLRDLYKSKANNINVNDYDPFGEKAFDDYLDKRGQSLKEKDEHFYKPIKPQKCSASSKELFAAQSVLNQERKKQNNASSLKSKSGFKIKNTEKVTTSSQHNIDDDTHNMDDLADIESYIAQQNDECQHNSQTSTDNTPDGPTSLDLLDPHSSPEPQRNASFHVVKKTKPKRKRKKKKDEKDRKDKREKKEKKKKKKRKKKENEMEMEPEDCTIRYGKESKYRHIISKKFYSGASKNKNKQMESNNPFDEDDEEKNNDNTLPMATPKASSTNPFADDLQSTNPFDESATQTTTTTPNTQKINSTNPFCDDLP